MALFQSGDLTWDQKLNGKKTSNSKRSIFQTDIYQFPKENFSAGDNVCFCKHSFSTVIKEINLIGLDSAPIAAGIALSIGAFGITNFGTNDMTVEAIKGASIASSIRSYVKGDATDTIVPRPVGAIEMQLSRKTKLLSPMINVGALNANDYLPILWNGPNDNANIAYVKVCPEDWNISQILEFTCVSADGLTVHADYAKYRGNAEFGIGFNIKNNINLSAANIGIEVIYSEYDTSIGMYGRNTIPTHLTNY